MMKFVVLCVFWVSYLFFFLLPKRRPIAAAAASLLLLFDMVIPAGLFLWPVRSR